MRNRTWSAIALLVAAAGACSGGGDAKATADTPATDPIAAAVQSVNAITTMQPVTLSESDVEHFVAALEELNRAGLQHQARLGENPSDASQMAEGLRGSTEALAILRKHDYDLVRFQTVAYTVAMAIGADELEKNPPKMDDAMAQVEKMKGQVPKEQYEAMLAAAKGATTMTENIRKQPEGNVELVRRYRERLDRIGKTG